MVVAPKVLVSIRSAPAAGSRSWMSRITSGRVMLEQLVVALHIARKSQPVAHAARPAVALAPVLPLAQLEALDHGAHGAVEDGDALLQEGGAAGRGCRVNLAWGDCGKDALHARARQGCLPGLRLRRPQTPAPPPACAADAAAPCAARSGRCRQTAAPPACSSTASSPAARRGCRAGSRSGG